MVITIMKKIVVLGGYGNFGKRIVENLASLKGITILIAGRNLDKSSALVESLKDSALARLHPFGPITKNIPILVLIFLILNHSIKHHD